MNKVDTAEARRSNRLLIAATVVVWSLFVLPPLPSLAGRTFLRGVVIGCFVAALMGSAMLAGVTGGSADGTW